MIAALAWRPFLDPLPLTHVWWALLVPLALFVSLAYKAVRVPDLDGPGGWARLARAVGVMTLQVVAAMVLLWVAFYLFVLYLLPVIAPMPGA